MSLSKRRRLILAGVLPACLAFLTIACGGSGNSSASPTDTTLPTVTITDDVTATSAKGPVVFTFTFSEAIDTTFTASKIEVSGGTIGSFTRTSAKVCTLVVTPPVNQTGTISVSVPAGAFKDLAGNANTQPASAQQDYDTTIPTVTITDDVDADVATGRVVFTFTFSEAIDTSFTAAKIEVTGGTGGSFTRTSATVSTLAVTPPASQTGTITISVPAGAFKDLAGNASTQVVSAQQGYNTAIPSVTITDDVAAETATGPVTFSFAFSQAIDTTFDKSKIGVSGGTAGAFTRSSDTLSTLVVAPPSTGSGTITVSVGVGAFRNLAGVANTASFNASQKYTHTISYKDPSLPADVRTANLLSLMSLDEKIGQMVQAERNSIGTLSDITTYGLGSILSGGGSAPATNTPAGWAAMVDAFQQQAMASRLGIPMIYGIDAVHGHNNAYGAVLFPHNIGLAAANDADLVKRIGQATAEEMKATGIRWTFAPCVAVPQDERWGRTYEGFGEVPAYSSTLGAAFIAGVQGTQVDSDSVIACAKHYLADGGTSGGTNEGDALISETLLRNIHLPPFEAAVDAGVATVMPSFSSWNGVKMHGNKTLLTDVLRGELGFAGFVVSDWDGIAKLPGGGSSAIATAINAGIDMAMLSGGYASFISDLKTLVNAGTVPLTRIDEAVSRILLVKFQMGLFEHPYSDSTLRGNFGTAAHRAIAREAVAKSVVLLKNDPVTLPITKSKVSTILVAGWKADDIGTQCGGWSISWRGSTGAITPGTTLREAIEAAAGSQGMTVTYSYDGTLAVGSSKPDLVIAAIGEPPYAEGYGDSSTLALPDEDATLFSNVQAIGKPIVTVLYSGRPMLINSYLDGSSAFLAAWLPGTEGDGLADVLFGTVKPSGTLPHTWPEYLSQVPINSGDGQKGKYDLGYGLSF